MENSELLPCPFALCGGRAIMWDGLGTQAKICCELCESGIELQVVDYCPNEVRFADGNSFDIYTQAYPPAVTKYVIATLIEAWNTRTPPPERVTVEEVAKVLHPVLRGKFAVGGEDEARLCAQALKAAHPHLFKE